MDTNPDEPLLEVVAAVIVDDGRVLACRRSPLKDSAGLWEFPGGKVEEGESASASLVREISEELGVVVEVGELLDRSVTGVGGRDIALSCYFATLTGPRPTSSTDHDRMLWARIPELSALDWSPPDLPAVRRLVGNRS
ncbi:(deoxy)nucleoside triphosphate pyrophosphohydrolase [Leifsonia sp. NPDC058230]|uniref:(deoxy)nucleoside triphosphate pyrophosphohydrolase n=1 Tax=Leifsonia sp. NPDC058230 TaxID=3346391 RepID=UPI0036D7E5B3